MESRIKTISIALKELDVNQPDFRTKKEQLVTEWEKERELIALRNRCINSGLPINELKKAGFNRWKSNNNIEVDFQRLAWNYALKISGNNSTANCSNHGNIVVSGKSGTGKTFAAASIIKYLASTKKPPVMIAKHNIASDVWEDVPLDIQSYRQSYYTKASRIVAVAQDRNNFEAKHDLKIGANISDFVVIDEIGRSLQPRIEREMIFDILDYRADAGLPTMLISNLEDEELRDHLGSAIMSRLIADCIYFNTTGIADRRISNAE